MLDNLKENCLLKGIPLTILYPEQRGRPRNAERVAQLAQEQELKDLCASCPSLSNCYDYALKHEEYGFWAGTTEDERIALRRKFGIMVERFEMKRLVTSFGRDVPDCGTERGYQRHYHLETRKNGIQVTCDACLKAHTRKNKKSWQTTRRAVAECGTKSGYTRHRRLGEDACEQCKEANARYKSELRAWSKINTQLMEGLNV